MNQINLVLIFPALILFSLLRLVLPNDILLQVSPSKPSMHLLLSTRDPCPVHNTLIDMITLIFVDGYKQLKKFKFFQTLCITNKITDQNILVRIYTGCF
jgi:hypothetical protein